MKRPGTGPKSVRPLSICPASTDTLVNCLSPRDRPPWATARRKLRSPRSESARARSAGPRRCAGRRDRRNRLTTSTARSSSRSIRYAYACWADDCVSHRPATAGGSSTRNSETSPGSKNRSAPLARPGEPKGRWRRQAAGRDPRPSLQRSEHVANLSLRFLGSSADRPYPKCTGSSAGVFSTERSPRHLCHGVAASTRQTGANMAKHVAKALWVVADIAQDDRTSTRMVELADLRSACARVAGCGQLVDPLVRHPFGTLCLGT